MSPGDGNVNEDFSQTSWFLSTPELGSGHQVVANRVAASRGGSMRSYQNRFERRDLILAVITGIIGGSATVMAAIGVILLAAHG
jgi:hypothetical protein